MNPVLENYLIIYWCLGLLFATVNLKLKHDDGYDITLFSLVVALFISTMWPVVYSIMYIGDVILLKGKPNGLTSKP